MSFEQARVEELPSILHGSEGEAFVRAEGKAQDDETAALRVAAISRFVDLCPDDALDGVGGWTDIERFPDEPNDVYRGRLKNGWQTWAEAGAPQSVIDSLNGYGIPSVITKSDYDGHFAEGDWYSRTYVFLLPNDVALGFLLGTALGASVGPFAPLVAPFIAPATGGSSASISQVRAVKRQILKWKFALGYPVKCVLVFPGAIVGNVNSTAPFTPVDGATICVWHIGKLCKENILTGAFTPGGFDV